MSTRISIAEVVGSVAILFAVGAALAYGLWWFATDRCLDSGGAVSGFSCAGSGASETPLTELVPLSLTFVVVVFFAVLIARTIRNYARKATPPSKGLG